MITFIININKDMLSYSVLSKVAYQQILNHFFVTLLEKWPQS